MACTSFYREHGNRWLTSFGKDAKAGDESTISVGHPVLGGEFITYHLGKPLGMSPHGEPLFDIEAPETLIRAGIASGPLITLAEARKHKERLWEGDTELYRRTSFGGGRLIAA